MERTLLFSLKLILILKKMVDVRWSDALEGESNDEDANQTLREDTTIKTYMDKGQGKSIRSGAYSS